MADIKDVSLVIASALSEISLAGTLDVAMDGGETVSVVGSGGDDVEVTVVVKRVEQPSPVTPLADLA